jgi:hypothetical protein
MGALARVPGAVAALGLAGCCGRCRAAMSAAPLTVEPVPDELLKARITPLRDRPVRRDVVGVLRPI